MKFVIAILFLILPQEDPSPLGFWLFKEDNSRIEFNPSHGKLYGTLISSDNPNRKAGMVIFKNVELLEGKWKAEFYSHKSERWFDVNVEVKEKILLITYTYGFQTKTFHFYREK